MGRVTLVAKLEIIAFGIIDGIVSIILVPFFLLAVV